MGHNRNSWVCFDGNAAENKGWVFKKEDKRQSSWKWKSKKEGEKKGYLAFVYCHPSPRWASVMIWFPFPFVWNNSFGRSPCVVNSLEHAGELRENACDADTRTRGAISVCKHAWSYRNVSHAGAVKEGMWREDV